MFHHSHNKQNEETMVAVNVSDHFVASAAPLAPPPSALGNLLGGFMFPRKSSYDQDGNFYAEYGKTEHLKFEGKVNEIRVNEEDVEKVLADPAQFAKLQEALRERQSMTDSTLKYLYHNLIRERIDDMKRVEAEAEKGAVEVSVLDGVDQKLLLSWSGTDFDREGMASPTSIMDIVCVQPEIDQMSDSMPKVQRV